MTWARGSARWGLCRRRSGAWLEAALIPRPRPRGASKVDCGLEAPIVAIAQSDPPSGRKRWTLRLIADRLVELGYGSASREAVRQVVKNAVIP